jgi:hypothetical protein
VTQGGDITYKIAQDSISRSLFQTNGTLDNQTDPNFRSISPIFTVFGIARDLGTIQATQDPIVWAVGFITEPAINYTDLSGASQQRSLFYKTQYSNDTSLVSIRFINNSCISCCATRLLTFLMISPMRLQEPSNWIRRYSRKLRLSLDYSEIWLLLRQHKCTAAFN